VIAVCDECSTVDLPADSDSVDGDGFVAEEADDASGRHPAEQRDRLRVDQAIDCLIASDERTEQDNRDDHDAGQILDAPESVGEARAGFAPREQKRDPERHSGGRITDIVDRIREQRHAARQQDNDELQGRRDAEDNERPLDGPDPALGRRNRGVDHTVRVNMLAAIGVAMAMVMTVCMSDVGLGETEPDQGGTQHRRGLRGTL
jgi:hypothetical protein